LEPGEPKDYKSCTVFDLFTHFGTSEQISELKQAYINGISWGDAKETLFNIINTKLSPIREKHDELIQNKDFLNDVLSDGANKVRSLAKNKISEIKDTIGIKLIS
jgi:tryptophanyl-tRNA synthetase